MIIFVFERPQTVYTESLGLVAAGDSIQTKIFMRVGASDRKEPCCRRVGTQPLKPYFFRATSPHSTSLVCQFGQLSHKDHSERGEKKMLNFH